VIEKLVPCREQLIGGNPLIDPHLVNQHGPVVNERLDLRLILIDPGQIDNDLGAHSASTPARLHKRPRVFRDFVVPRTHPDSLVRGLESIQADADGSYPDLDQQVGDFRAQKGTVRVKARPRAKSTLRKKCENIRKPRIQQRFAAVVQTDTRKRPKARDFVDDFAEQSEVHVYGGSSLVRMALAVLAGMQSAHAAFQIAPAGKLDGH
jgi:hypothetical protein